MDALKFIEERNRMCKSFGGCCDDCPADKNTCCDAFEWQKELVALVEEWSTAHPRKTRQSVFLERYPEAQIDDNDVLSVCPAVISHSHRKDGGGCFNIHKKCTDCRREFWMQEVE